MHFLETSQNPYFPGSNNICYSSLSIINNKLHLILHAYVILEDIYRALYLFFDSKKRDLVLIEEKSIVITTERTTNNKNETFQQQKYESALNAEERRLIRMKNALWRRMSPSISCIGKDNKLVSPKTLKCYITKTSQTILK
ncbi:10186_t:CDS:2 [Cetraspora pellucida]|uniref:10186_t:CDS:1 n=1 Tax=Cetraspora pellucida TaxID=1433469 RepID=A0A9N8W6T4_9GLOM|nr:10186_t:CDS:2 [Cetraspora pellucida]